MKIFWQQFILWIEKKLINSLYIEQRLSYEIGHVGKLTYNHELVNAEIGVEDEPARNIA